MKILAPVKGTLGNIGRAVGGIFSSLQPPGHMWILIELTNGLYVRFEIGGASVHDSWSSAMSQGPIEWSGITIEYYSAQIENSCTTDKTPGEVKDLAKWIAEKNGEYSDTTNNCQHFATELWNRI
jgi:hypothetical protein